MTHRAVLHSDKNLIITLITDEENDRLSLDIQATKHGPDLSQSHDVVVILDGKGATFELMELKNAVAFLGKLSELEGKTTSLMVRIYEFFDGWEFDL